jgi:hypothetical protein
VKRVIDVLAAASADSLAADIFTYVPRENDAVRVLAHGRRVHADVAGDVLRLLGQEEGRGAGGGEGSRTLHAAVIVARRDGGAGGWTALVETKSDGGSGGRSMHGESCEAIAQATALFLALAIDPESAPPVVQPQHDNVPPEPASRSPWPWVGASARVDTATAPRPSLGGEVSVAWRPDPFRLEAGFTDWAPQSDTLLQSPSVGGRFSMVSATLRGCFERRLASVALGPCVAAELDRVSAEGYLRPRLRGILRLRVA